MRVGKRTRWLIGVGVAVAIAVGVGLYRLTPGPIARAVQTEIANQQRLLDLRKLTPFAWTDLWLFRGHAERAKICEALKIADFRCWWMVPNEIRRGEIFLVFLKNSTIAHYEHWYPMSEPELLGPDHVRSNDAQFEVNAGDTITTMSPRPRSNPAMERTAYQRRIASLGAADTAVHRER
jgi:hypothetical protein